MEHGKHKVMQSQTLAAAVKMKFPKEMAEFANITAQESVEKFKACTKKDQP